MKLYCQICKYEFEKKLKEGQELHNDYLGVLLKETDPAFPNGKNSWVSCPKCKASRGLRIKK